MPASKRRQDIQPHMHASLACVCAHSVMSDSLRPHRLQPASLLCPQGFPGKNAGVSCRFLSQGNLPNPGIKHTSPASLALAGRFFTTAPPGKPHQLRDLGQTETSYISISSLGGRDGIKTQHEQKLTVRANISVTRGEIHDNGLLLSTESKGSFICFVVAALFVSLLYLCWERSQLR